MRIDARPVDWWPSLFDWWLKSRLPSLFDWWLPRALRQILSLDSIRPYRWSEDVNVTKWSLWAVSFMTHAPAWTTPIASTDPICLKGYLAVTFEFGAGSGS